MCLLHAFTFSAPQVGDQMKLLHNCWSELLVLDYIARQLHHGKDDSVLLITGQEVHTHARTRTHTHTHTNRLAVLISCMCGQVELVSLLAQAGVTLSGMIQRGQELVHCLQELQLDRRETACLKYLMLFNPGENIYLNLSYTYKMERIYEKLSFANRPVLVFSVLE